VADGGASLDGITHARPYGRGDDALPHGTPEHGQRGTGAMKLYRPLTRPAFSMTIDDGFTAAAEWADDGASCTRRPPANVLRA
jgi:hypothetical protein